MKKTCYVLSWRTPFPSQKVSSSCQESRKNFIVFFWQLRSVQDSRDSLEVLCIFEELVELRPWAERKKTAVQIRIRNSLFSLEVHVSWDVLGILPTFLAKTTHTCMISTVFTEIFSPAFFVTQQHVCPFRNIHVSFDFCWAFWRRAGWTSMCFKHGQFLNHYPLLIGILIVHNCINWVMLDCAWLFSAMILCVLGKAKMHSRQIYGCRRLREIAWICCSASDRCCQCSPWTYCHDCCGCENDQLFFLRAAEICREHTESKLMLFDLGCGNQ